MPPWLRCVHGISPCYRGPPVVDFPVLHDSWMPTHVLALYPPYLNKYTSPQPFIAPVDVDLYNQGFRVDLIPPLPLGSTRPVPHSTSEGLYVSIPLVLPLTTVPHPPSMSLLSLFPLGLEASINDLAYCMLPVSVVDEFPDAAAMAQVMVSLSEEEFERRFQFNMGLWKNVLGLGVTNNRVIEAVHLAFNVTPEARRLRNRQLNE
ncbi:hypothetical protein IW262DRAFT_869957 [Armillaria fumosa]|nr:hypothetical protein IW262DRAFT_869781 [Armillaria fumosa]KAK0224023.1 hypothetical protein IW262DRAFT_869957 [Armillaria fumosa]